jgi:hypothetical protein
MSTRSTVVFAVALAVTACADPTAATSGTEASTGDSTTGGGGSDVADSADESGVAPMVCGAGTRVCGSGEVLVCADDGTRWDATPCAAGEICLDGMCAADGLTIITDVVPPGTLGFEYVAQLQAEGGVTPYAWQVGAGEVPPGLTLGDTGDLSGMPTLPGDYVFESIVTDAAGDTAARSFSIAVHPEPLTIITLPDLGAFDEGMPMNVPLLALGGVAPHGWLLVDGALPDGVIVDAAGAVTGTPLQPGPFDFRVRVVDAQRPPGYDEQDFTLQIDLRPLSVVGSTQYDLLAFKVIVLPLLAVVPGIPIPYSTQLEADGGLMPYTWSEQPLPNGLDVIIPQAGVPADLVLHPDGELSGSVTNTDQVVTVPLLLAGIDLTGFFFYAEVADSQNPAETANALFVIPTLPVGP